MFSPLKKLELLSAIASSKPRATLTLLSRSPNFPRASITWSTQAKISQISPTFPYFVINNALLYHFLENWLAHNKKMTEKSVFRKAWSPEMTSHSFSVSCFSLAVLYPTGSKISRFWYIQTRGRKIALVRFFWLYLSVHWGDLIEQIKKIVIYTQEPT